MSNWQVTGYYAEDVKPPKQAGELAISVRCLGDGTKAAELAAFERRGDIGEVEVVELPDDATLNWPKL